ncbi:hypothetical protein GCM10028827_25350 [Mucilaginibacter myungsuensis]
MEVMSKFDKEHMEVFRVLKRDVKTREGLYQMRYKKKTAVASGVYRNDKRTGVWHFYDSKGKILQNFDYDKNQVTFEAPEAVSPIMHFNYRIDEKFTEKDSVIRPIKIGGRYYGYLPILKLFKRPADIGMDGSLQIPAIVELLISPGGNLADYVIHIDGLDLNVNLNLLTADEKRFVPATKNGQPIQSTIIIPCKMTMGGKLISLSDMQKWEVTETN